MIVKGTAGGGTLTTHRSSNRENALGSPATVSEGGGISGESMLKALRDSHFLSGFTAAETETVSEACVRKSLRRVEAVLLEGDSAGAIRLVVSGTVSLYRTSYQGKEHIVRSGEAFDDATAFDGCVSLFSVRALAPVVLYTISRDDLQTLMLACPRLAVNVAGLLAHEERRYLYWLRISP